jgi:hypothetical protein
MVPVRCRVAILLGVVLFVAGVAKRADGQGQALAGTWTLDPASKGGGRGGGVPGFPLATQLTIKVSPAEVTVDSDTGSAQSIQGNRAMANILSAARAEEKAVAEAAKRGIKLTVSDSPTAAEGER